MNRTNFLTTFFIVFIVEIFQSYQIQSMDKEVKQSILPDGFVYVDQVDPTIISNLRYFTEENFVGERLIGYYTNRAILTKKAAQALKQANIQFLKDGYNIVVYDSYRPQKTVNRFVQWSLNQSAVEQKLKYYPYVEKSVLFEQGYIAKKSGHSRGSTLDMSIICKQKQLKPIEQRLRQLFNKKLIFLLDDNSEDMGTSFDFLDQSSHPQSKLLSKQIIQKRKYMINVMQKNGFNVLDTQWWHFTLIDQPFKNIYFDFDIK